MHIISIGRPLFISIELIKQMKNSIECPNGVIFNDKLYMHLSYANHHDNGLTYTGNKRLIKIISIVLRCFINTILYQMQSAHNIHEALPPEHHMLFKTYHHVDRAERLIFIVTNL